VNQPSSFLAIDEFGRFLENEIRISDQNRLETLFKNLHYSDWGALISNTDEQSYIIEAFEAPWVIMEIQLENEKILGLNTYGFSTTLNLETCYFDEWDRLHGRNDQNVPWVLSRNAQESFFDQLDEFDDDSFVFQGKRYNTQPTSTPIQSRIVATASEPHAALKDMLPRMKLPKSRVLILGGPTAEIEHWKQEGHVVTAISSLEEIFHLPRQFDKAFDFIFEHGLLSSVEPQKRSDVLQIWNRCLLQGGYYMGIFLVMPQKQGPPFGISEWEIRQRLQKDYHFLFWGRWKESLPSLQGKELFVLAQKK